MEEIEIDGIGHRLMPRIVGMNSIRQILVLNKSDLLATDDLDALCRQLSLDKPVDCVAISAIQRETLRPLVERIAASIGTFAVSQAR